MHFHKVLMPRMSLAIWLVMFFVFTDYQPKFALAEIDRVHHTKTLFKKHAQKKSALPAQGTQIPGSPAPERDSSPPFEPKLARLAEILGALSYLEPLCSGSLSYDWQGKTAALVNAEAKSDLEKNTIIGAYNHGFAGYSLSYRTCTPNAQRIIARFVSEGTNLSQDIMDHYGSS